MTVAPGSDLPSFGTLLKAFRKRRRLTQQQLAETLGMHRHAVGRWELGDFLPASKTIVLELARQLRLDEAETRALLEVSLTARSPHGSVPLPRNPYFTVRDEIVEALHLQLGMTRAVALTQSSALCGLGGVGKTQIALEYAYRHALDYSAVFWIGAETAESIISSLLRIAKVLQLPERDDQDQQRVLAAVNTWLTTHYDWLLIWDNLESVDLLARFLPPTRQGAILITTRCQALGTLARGIDLEPLGQEEGILFLLRRAKILDSEATSEHVRQLAGQNPSVHAAAHQLVTELGRLPLALDQAGAYIEETGCGLAEYVQRYLHKRQVLLDRRGLSSDHPLSVVATIRLACQRVGEQEPTALELLRCCAFLSAEAIPEELLLAGADHLGPVLGPIVSDATAFDLALATLRRYSLVQRHPDSRTFSLHRLVQVILQEELPEQEQELWRQRLVHLLNTVFPAIPAETTVELCERCERLLPQVTTCAITIAEHVQDQDLAEVVLKAAKYLFQRSQYEQGSLLCQRALRLFEQTLGPQHLQVALSLHSLAAFYRQQGKYVQAEPLAERAVHLFEQALGPEHLLTAIALGTLADLYREQGRYELAQPLYHRSLRHLEQSLGAEHPQLAYPLEGLANLLRERGDYAEAESYYQRALSIRERHLGQHHPETAQTVHELAILHQQQGNLNKACSLAERALAIRSRSLGDLHPKTRATRMLHAELVRAGTQREAQAVSRQPRDSSPGH